MQGPGEYDSSGSASIRRWHPKLTPYRLLVLMTTVGVGTAKAVVAQEGYGNTSTTLEWVFGVVIFLIFHGMSTYDEDPKDPPPFLSWFFAVDCMDYLWRLLLLLRIPRPSYSSETETAPPPDIDGNNKKRRHNAMPVTLYRLFVCVTTMVFGLGKAVLTYSGYCTGANWVDWTLGVVITLLLFVLGMYENNTVEIWHGFFVPDYSAQIKNGLGAASISLMMLAWIGACLWSIPDVWNGEDKALHLREDAPVPVSPLTPLAMLQERLFDACFALLMLLMIVTSVFSGVAGVAAVLITSGLSRWKEAGEWMMPMFKDGSMAQEPQQRSLWKKITYQAVSFVIFLPGCVVFFACWAVSVAVNVEELNALLHNNPDSKTGSKSDWRHLIFLGITILFQLTGAAVTAFLTMFVVLGLFFFPLSKWRSGAKEWEKALLF